MADARPPETSTLASARAHARSQADAVELPPPALPPGVDPTAVVWDELLEPGNYVSRVVPRNAVVRLTDIDGDACVQLLAYRWSNTAERINVADTVKVQWQAYLTTGSLLLSDMGRALATIVDDTSARHDCLCGSTNHRSASARWGDGSASGPTPNGRDLLALGAAKHGLARVDVTIPVNLFKGCRVDDDGTLSFRGDPVAGTHVDLRAEMDLLLVLADTPHPLDDRDGYRVTPVRCTAWVTERPLTDPFRDTTPERLRAFERTEALLAGGVA